MFAEVLERLEGRLALPYPDRALFLEELAGDLEAAYRTFLDEGLPEDEARLLALKELEPDDAALDELARIHRPKVQEALKQLPPPLRSWLEPLALALPIAVTILLMVQQVPLLSFLREGGTASWVILFVGLLGVALELRRWVVLFVLKDHSPEALRRHGRTPIYLAAATFCLGLQGAAIGWYVVFQAWAEGLIDQQTLPIGLKEPLSCLIVGTSLAIVIILGHGAVQAGLRTMRVPEV